MKLVCHHCGTKGTLTAQTPEELNDLIALYEKFRLAAAERKEKSRFKKIEYQLEQIVFSYKADGKKIPAIKEIRRIMGWTLSKSKDYVDNLWER